MHSATAEEKKLDSLTKAFAQIMSAERGDFLCEIIKRKPLKPAQEKKQTSSLAGFTKTGEKILLSMKVHAKNPDGLIVPVGN